MDIEPRVILRVEGVVLLAAALGAFLVRDAGWVPFLLAAVAPDLSMAGYAIDERWGARAYNVAHTTLLPAALLGAGLFWGVPLAVAWGLGWLAHLGADRALGYGLKYPGAAFRDTHLGRV